jgi:hypothetical protein
MVRNGVFGWSYGPKILDPVVVFNSVYMVNLKPIWNFPIAGHPNQPMRNNLFSSCRDAKITESVVCLSGNRSVAPNNRAIGINNKRLSVENNGTQRGLFFCGGHKIEPSGATSTPPGLGEFWVD